MPEVPEGFVIHLLGEWTKTLQLLFPLRSLYLRAFAVRILAALAAFDAHASPADAAHHPQLGNGNLYPFCAKIPQ